MQILRTLDPRDNLEKARRLELVKFAKDNGVNVSEDMPAILIRKLLRARKLTRIEIEQRKYGQVPGAAEPDAMASDVNAINADDDLWRQWRDQAPTADTPAKKVSSIIELRRECKRRGIKYARTDKAADLRAKLDVKNAP